MSSYKVIRQSLVSTLLCKRLESHHLQTYKKNLNKLKINYFSWTYHKTKVEGQTDSFKSGKLGKTNGDISGIPEEEAARLISWQKH